MGLSTVTASGRLRTAGALAPALSLLLFASPAFAASSVTKIEATGTNGTTFVKSVDNAASTLTLRAYAAADSNAATGVVHSFKATDSSKQTYAVFASDELTQVLGAVASGDELRVTAESGAVAWYGITVEATPECGQHCEVVYAACQEQSFTVPEGVTQVEYTVVGGAGGGDAFVIGLNTTIGTGGTGGSVKGKLAVSEGEVLHILAGGGGAQPTGGCNGGGNGEKQLTGEGGGGGGGSFLYAGTTLIAAAGGGGGAGGKAAGGKGGNPGGAGTGTAKAAEGGKGATSSAVGAGGTGASVAGNAGTGPTTTSSKLAKGGSAKTATLLQPIGGGGGGYYGGGSGASSEANAAGSGGGGSDFAAAIAANTEIVYDSEKSAAGADERGDNGRVVLKYTRPHVAVTVTGGAATRWTEIGQAVTMTAKITPIPEDASPGRVNFRLLSAYEVGGQSCEANVDPSTGEASCNIANWYGAEYEWVAEYTGSEDGVYAGAESAPFFNEWGFPEPPSNSSPPKIEGLPSYGGTVTVSPGTWNEDAQHGGALSFAYRWWRCHAENFESCVSDFNEGESDLLTGDLGEYELVEVTARNGRGEESTVRSSYLGPVEFGPLPPQPGEPRITGEAAIGQTLTAEPGSWGGTAPITYTYQWQRCNGEGEECAGFTPSEATRYRVAGSDLGHTFRVHVTAKNALGEGSETSEATAPVPGVYHLSVASLTSAKTTASYSIDYDLAEESGHYRAGEACSEYRKAGASAWSTTCVAVGESRCTHGSEHFACSVPVEVTGLSEATEYELRVSVKAHSVPTAEVGEESFTTGATAPSSSAAPELLVAGAPATVVHPGETVEATTGTWTGTEPIDYSYSWEDCNAEGAECSAIGGATSSSYVPLARDAGHSLVVLVTAGNAGGEAPARSLPLPVEVAPPTSTLPPNVRAPYVLGTEVEAEPGGWEGEGLEYAYRWEVCEAEEAGCEAIAGGVEPNLRIADYETRRGELQRFIRVTVTATNQGGEASAHSAAAPVEAEPAGISGVPALSGEAAAGAVLSVGGVSVEGDPEPAVGYQWYLCSAAHTGCEAIAGAREASYTVAAPDEGHTLTVLVTASNDEWFGGGEDSVMSAYSAIVSGPSPAPEEPGGGSGPGAGGESPGKTPPSGGGSASEGGTAPGAGAAPDGGSTGAGADSTETVPVVSRLAVAHRCVAPQAVALARSDAARQLTFSFELSRAGTVTYSLSRRVGSPRWDRCPAPTNGKKANEYEQVWSGSTPGALGPNDVAVAARARAPQAISGRRLSAGAHRVRLAGVLASIASSRLVPGTYVLSVRAANAQGALSQEAHVKFWVVGQDGRGR